MLDVFLKYLVIFCLLLTFKTVSTDDSFREYFKGSREMGTACSSIYVNYTSINQFKKKKKQMDK